MLENVDWGVVCFQMTLALISSGIVGALLNHLWNKKADEKDKAFEKEISELKAKLDSGTYVTNMQYEREFKMIYEIWKMFTKLYQSFSDLFNEIPSTPYIFKPEKFEGNIYKIRDCLMSYNKITTLTKESIMNMKPFINFNIYIEIYDLIDKHDSFSEALVMELYMFKDDLAEYSKKSEIDYNEIKRCIEQSRDKLSNAIYDYLNSLKVK